MSPLPKAGAPDRPATVINLSDQSPQWQWLRDAFVHQNPDWHHISSRSQRPVLPLFRDRMARRMAAHQALDLARRATGPVVFVSHGPKPANHLGHLMGHGHPAAHLAFSFNFTALPRGLERYVMRHSFRQVDRFVVASTLERGRYAHCFDIDPARIDVLPWGVRPPQREALGSPLINPPYLCALGSQARDYGTLARAMRLLPSVKLVLVATPESVTGVSLPDNIELRTNIPRAQAMNLLAHSRAMVLPLADEQAACGHVTAVSALHLGVPIASTHCLGLADYLQDGHSALISPVADERRLAANLQRLWEAPDEAQALARTGRAFAAEHCTEDNVVRYFTRFLANLAPSTSSA